MTTKKTIQETGFGWITPSGKIVATTSYYHMAADMLALMDGVPDFSDITERLEDVRENCQALEDIEGASNAEWHNYEIACDNAAPEKYGRMMEAGFIRVGTRTGDGWVYLEGTSKARAKLGEAIVRVTDLFGRGLSAFKYEEWKTKL